MRTDDGTGPEGVVYICDVCGTKTPARVTYPRGTKFKTAAMPVGWFWLEGKHPVVDGPIPRLRADLCSLKCAHEQIDEWANAPVKEEADEGD